MIPLTYHPATHSYDALIQEGLREDIGRGDITSTVFIESDEVMHCAIVARQSLIACGLRIASEVFHHVDARIEVGQHTLDGEAVESGTRLLHISGNARHVLAAERTALNFISYLSGIATHTARCVKEVEGTGVTILDTRKTIPAYRDIAKYAVRCGGGKNHRMRLDDGVMIKDNHIAIAGDIVSAVEKTRAQIPALTKIEVECDTLSQVRAALTAKPDVIMLDNMSVEEVREAVSLVNGAIPLEASGGMTFDTLRDYALTGVSCISMGALTHSVVAVDVGLDVIGESC